MQILLPSNLLKSLISILISTETDKPSACTLTLVQMKSGQVKAAQLSRTKKNRQISNAHAKNSTTTTTRLSQTQLNGLSMVQMVSQLYLLLKLQK